MKKFLGLLTIMVFALAYCPKADAQLSNLFLMNYSYVGNTRAETLDRLPVAVRWTVTYEANWTKLIFSDGNKVAIENELKGICKRRIITFFGKYTKNDFVSAGIVGIQEAFDNPDFISSMADEMLTAFGRLLNTQEVPEFKIIGIRLNLVNFKVNPL